MSPRRADPRDAGAITGPGAVQLQTFPSADAGFAAYVEEALVNLRGPTTGALQDQIRARYPVAVVREQDPLARRGPGAIVWYAFRYGTVADGPPGMPMVAWEGADIAWAILDDERRFVDLNDALATIVEQPREAIVGRTVEEFTNPQDPSIREDVAALWRQFVETGWVESTIRYNRIDGRRRQFAYRLVADDPEPGRHRLRVAEIDPG